MENDGSRRLCNGSGTVYSTIDGIDDAVKNGSMKYLEPGETREYNLTFHILKGRKEFEELKKRTEK